MLFRWAVESADRLIVSSCGNHTDIHPSSPNAPRPTLPMPHNLIIVDTDMLFSLCRTADCIPTRETRIHPSHRPQHWCVHRLGRWNIWSSRWCTCMATMFTYSTLFPPQPHLHCIYIRESISLLMTMLITFYFLCIISWLYPCIGRFVSIVSLIVWHITAAPLLARFDRSFVISNENSYTYVYGSSLSFWSYAEGVGRPRFNRRQVPCSSRSICPVYVVVAPTYFPHATLIVE